MRIFVRILFGVMAFALAWSAFAQTYPTRPVRLLVGYAAGGGADGLARVLAARLSGELGQQVVVENRPGAAGAVAADVLVKAAPDGYTLYFAESGALIAPSINPRIAYDPVRNFAPVGAVCTLPLAFVVNPGFPAKSTQELITVLRANPGKYSYASPGVGTVQHFAFELFMRSAGVNVLHIPYKGAASMMPDIISGQVPIGVISAAAAIGQMKAGKIRTIGVTSPQRLASAPDWPALAETLPGFDAAPRLFVVAPTGTTQAVIGRMNGAIRAALASRELQENYAKQGTTTTPGTPEELGAQIAAEVKSWSTIAREANIKAE